MCAWYPQITARDLMMYVRFSSTDHLSAESRDLSFIPIGKDLFNPFSYKSIGIKGEQMIRRPI
jgi:hypothetical protein